MFALRTVIINIWIMRILNYNVYTGSPFPFFCRRWREATSLTDNRIRAERQIDLIIVESPDIVLLQEVYEPELRRLFAERLSREGFNCQDDTSGNTIRWWKSHRAVLLFTTVLSVFLVSVCAEYIYSQFSMDRSAWPVCLAITALSGVFGMFIGQIVILLVFSPLKIIHNWAVGDKTGLMTFWKRAVLTIKTVRREIQFDDQMGDPLNCLKKRYFTITRLTPIDGRSEENATEIMVVNAHLNAFGPSSHRNIQMHQIADVVHGHERFIIGVDANTDSVEVLRGEGITITLTDPTWDPATNGFANTILSKSTDAKTIDYVFCSSNWKVNNIQAFGNDLSDHSGIICDIIPV